MTSPHLWKPIYFADIGTEEPFVTRISLGLTEVLGAARFDDENKREIKTAVLGVCTDCLMPAFLSLRELRNTASNPQVPVLTKIKHFDDLCKWLWNAYKDRMQNAARLMGYDIGFLFQNDSLFEKGCEEFPKANPNVSVELINRMELARTTWQRDLARFRNDYLEHQTLKREDVVAFYSLERAEALFERVWVTIEEILVLLIAAHLHPATCLREIPEDERNPELPKRFGFAWRSLPQPETSPQEKQ